MCAGVFRLITHFQLSFCSRHQVSWFNSQKVVDNYCNLNFISFLLIRTKLTKSSMPLVSLTGLNNRYTFYHYNCWYHPNQMCLLTWCIHTCRGSKITINTIIVAITEPLNKVDSLDSKLEDRGLGVESILSTYYLAVFFKTSSIISIWY